MALVWVLCFARIFNIQSNSADPEQVIHLASFNGQSAQEEIATAFAVADGHSSWASFAIFWTSNLGRVCVVCPVIPFNASIPQNLLFSLRLQLAALKGDASIRARQFFKDAIEIREIQDYDSNIRVEGSKEGAGAADDDEALYIGDVSAGRTRPLPSAAPGSQLVMELKLDVDEPIEDKIVALHVMPSVENSDASGVIPLIVTIVTEREDYSIHTQSWLTLDRVLPHWQVSASHNSFLEIPCFLLPNPTTEDDASDVPPPPELPCSFAVFVDPIGAHSLLVSSPQSCFVLNLPDPSDLMRVCTGERSASARPLMHPSIQPVTQDEFLMELCVPIDHPLEGSNLFLAKFDWDPQCQVLRIVQSHTRPELKSLTKSNTNTVSSATTIQPHNFMEKMNRIQRDFEKQVEEMKKIKGEAINVAGADAEKADKLYTQYEHTHKQILLTMDHSRIACEEVIRMIDICTKVDELQTASMKKAITDLDKLSVETDKLEKRMEATTVQAEQIMERCRLVANMGCVLWEDEDTLTRDELLIEERAAQSSELVKDFSSEIDELAMQMEALSTKFSANQTSAELSSSEVDNIVQFLKGQTQSADQLVKEIKRLARAERRLASLD
jgi:outer membrane murein-binding lipoprotein Lpp